jgi:hypothetical protein
MKTLAAFCALAVLLLGTIGSAGAAKKKRPFCKPANSKVLAKTSSVRILYVERPAQADEYGAPATVYACFPSRHRRVRLFEISSTEAWRAGIIALSSRFVAFAATVDDVACQKYQQPNCTSSYVAVFRLLNGKRRCGASATSTRALTLTSNGWVAWLDGSTPGRLSACDSAGTRKLDEGNIDAASVRARGTSVEWTRDGQPHSAALK